MAILAPESAGNFVDIPRGGGPNKPKPAEVKAWSTMRFLKLTVDLERVMAPDHVRPYSNVAKTKGGHSFQFFIAIGDPSPGCIHNHKSTKERQFTMSRMASISLRFLTQKEYEELLASVCHRASAPFSDLPRMVIRMQRDSSRHLKAVSG
eukprot:4883678-Ditylum_brightwellii.AAC.1